MQYDNAIHVHATPFTCIRCGGVVTEFQRPSATQQVELCPACGPVPLGTVAGLQERVTRVLMANGYTAPRARRDAQRAVRGVS